MERNKSIDILRFVCAFLVIMVHTNYFCRDLIGILPKVAVPLFFAISGFCIYSSDNGTINPRLQSSLKKTGYLLIASTLLFFAFYLPMFLHVGFPPTSAYLDFLLFNEHPFGFHLWYLAAFLYVLVIYYGLSKTKHLQTFSCLFPFLLIFTIGLGIWMMSANGKIGPNYWTRNFLFDGLPFYSIGFLIARYQWGAKMSSTVFAVGLVVLIAFAMGEKYLLDQFVCQDYCSCVDINVSTILLSIWMAMFCTHRQNASIGTFGSKIATWGQRYSLYIYIFHPIFIMIYQIVLKRVAGFYENYYLPYIETIAVFSSAWILSVIYVRLKDRLRAKGFTSHLLP